MRIERSRGRLGKQKAEKYLQFNTYEGQRSLRSMRITELAKKLVDGRFTTARIAIVQPLNGGTAVLVNGQHQCHAIVNANVTVDMFLETFFLDDEDDTTATADIYAQFDEGGLRSVADIAKPYAVAYGMGEWGNRAIGNIVGALAYREWGQNARHHTKDARAKLLGKYGPDARFLHTVAWQDHDDTRHVRRVPVMVAMLATKAKSVADSAEFWGQVRDGELLKRTDPAHKLRYFLTNLAVGRGLRAANDNSRATWGEVIGKCYIAWNAYRTEKPLKMLKYVDAEGKAFPKLK